MALQFSAQVRNTQLDLFQSTIGTNAVLRIWTGTMPTAVSLADSGTNLITWALASNWANPASGGSKSWSGLPITATAANSGTAAFFRLYASDGVTCHMQGIITVAGGGGDMTLDSVTVTAGQSISILTWTWQAPGA